MKKLIAVLGLVMLTGASQAWAWTMYYDGFDYEPPTAVLYTYDALAYQLGDPLDYTPFHPLNHPWDYPASAWVAANNASSAGYWPVIMPENLDPPAPLPPGIGHVVQIYGTASNQGKTVRCSPSDLHRTPPSPPYPVFTSGTLYYSLMVKVINCGRLIEGVDPPAPGDFHAGFNHLPPDPSSPYVQAGAASARLRLRPTYGPELSDSFQIGIQSDEPSGSTSTVAWNPTVFFGGTGSTPVFVVVSYEFKNNEGPTPDTTDDVTSLWVNPDPATFGQATPPPPSVTSTGADANSLQIQSFFIRHGYSAGNPPRRISRACFDELRIGTTWAGVTSNEAPLCNEPRFDLDGDGDVDQADFAGFQICFTGTNDPGHIFDAEACRCVNSDGDLDIDGDDRAAFEACASGPGIIANPSCDDSLSPP